MRFLGVVVSCHVCGMWIEMAGSKVKDAAFRGYATYVACGLKCFQFELQIDSAEPCHVCGMWIEITMACSSSASRSGHATYVACGLK